MERTQKRAEQEQILKTAQANDLDISGIKKSMGKLTSYERSKLRAGDKSILYEKLGLVEEKDIQRLQSQFRVKTEDLENEDALHEQLGETQVLGQKKSKSVRHNRRIDLQKEHLEKMVHELHIKQKYESQLDEEDKQTYEAQQAKIKDFIRNDSETFNNYCPIIIKAKEAGVLETLMTETEKLIRGVYQINIISSGVGPITEADVN